MKFSTTLFVHVMRRPMGETEIDWIPVGEGPGYFDLDPADEIALYLPRAEDETVLILADEWLGCPICAWLIFQKAAGLRTKVCGHWHACIN